MKAGWRIGTAVGLAGLGTFVVLVLLMVVGLVTGSGGSQAQLEGAVGLFPWALGALGVGVLGMIVAGASRGAGPNAPDDDDEAGLAQSD